MEQTLQQNVDNIKRDVKEACNISNRPVEAVTTLCVSKSVDAETTKEIVELGITDLAENRVELLLEKKRFLETTPEIKWHFIGNLQRRKVKLVINEIDYFHALDSIKLAQEIQKRAIKAVNCFVQVNVSGEESKQGVSPHELLDFIDELEALDKVKIVGLMTMAPYEATEDELIQYFTELKHLQQKVAEKKLTYAPCQELSMGMSRDFKTAIKCGSTYIRIGTSFFKK